MIHTIIDNIIYAFVRMILALLRALPRVLAERVGEFIVRMIMLCVTRSKHVMRRNLELVFPEMTKEQHNRIMHQSYTVLGKNLVSFAKIPDMTSAIVQQRFDFSDVDKVIPQALLQVHRSKTRGSDVHEDNIYDNDANIDSVNASGANKVGVIIATLHFGLFEELMQAFVIKYGKAAVLARGSGLKKCDELLKSQRERFGCEVFARKGGYQEMALRLKNGQNTVILFDQNVKKNHAVFVNLFSIPAATTKAIGLASIRTGAPVIFATVAEDSPGHFKVIARAMPYIKDFNGSIDEKIIHLMNHLHAEAESVIRQYPDHWFWIHRRFKTRPEGEPENIY